MGQVRDMLNRPFEVKVAEAQGLIARNLRTYGDKAAIGCSFGKDSLIVVHMAIAQMPDTSGRSLMNTASLRDRRTRAPVSGAATG